jgi:hypothetical protein
MAPQFGVVFGAERDGLGGRLPNLLDPFGLAQSFLQIKLSVQAEAAGGACSR